MAGISPARIIERERDCPMEVIFAEAGQQSLSVLELAENLGITVETLQAWMKDEGFETYRGIRRKR